MRDLRKLWHLGWWARLDTLGHMLRLPRCLRCHLCDRFERSLDDGYVWVDPPPSVTTSANVTDVMMWMWSQDKP